MLTIEKVIQNREKLPNYEHHLFLSDVFKEL